MPLSRKTRLMAALFALCSLLFTQMAVAAYACPGMASAASSMPTVAGVAAAAHADCAQLDPQQSALCLAHCHPATPSVDKAEGLTLAPLLALGGVFLLLVMPALTRLCVPPLPPHFVRSAVPLSIRHCCFRI